MEKKTDSWKKTKAELKTETNKGQSVSKKAVLLLNEERFGVIGMTGSDKERTNKSRRVTTKSKVREVR